MKLKYPTPSHPLAWCGLKSGLIGRMAVCKCIQSHIACNLHMSSQNLIPIHHPQLDTRTSQSILIICNFHGRLFSLALIVICPSILRQLLFVGSCLGVILLGTWGAHKEATNIPLLPGSLLALVHIQCIGNSLHSSLGNKTHFKRLPRLLPIPRPCKL